MTPATPLLAGKEAAAGVRGADLWYTPEFESEFKASGFHCGFFHFGCWNIMGNRVVSEFR